MADTSYFGKRKTVFRFPVSSRKNTAENTAIHPIKYEAHPISSPPISDTNVLNIVRSIETILTT
jgi:hypothetical protein